jgi:hypothetical protein
VGEVAATKTPCTPQELVTALAACWSEVVIGGTPLTLECACVLASQWAIETGEGASMVQWNIGNFKWDGVSPYCQFQTNEYVNGVLKTITPPEAGCQFMAYPNLPTGVKAWLAALQRKWTLAWPSALAGNPEGFAEGLRNQSPPYYTGPASVYAAGMRRYFDPFLTSLTLPTDPLADTLPPTLPDLPETD